MVMVRVFLLSWPYTGGLYVITQQKTLLRILSHFVFLMEDGSWCLVLWFSKLKTQLFYCACVSTCVRGLLKVLIFHLIPH